MRREVAGSEDALIGDGLSPREKQLLLLAERGLTDQAIAKELGIGLATVGTYWGRIRLKFGPLSRTELVAKYLKEEAAKVVESLREDNQRLLAEVAEHSRNAKRLKGILDFFRGLIETAPDAILLVDQEGYIRLANHEAESLFGYSKDELLNLHVDQLVPERLRQVHAEHRNEYDSRPVKRRMGQHLATYGLRKDGTEFLVAATLSAMSTKEGVFATCIVRSLKVEKP
ncbi:MAG: PAS domain S-box protein [Armatimonadetes bacterium]|nr:PAS domain S-box protein [Armatimonadota bacterium]